MPEFHMCLYRRAATTERTSKRAIEAITISPVLFSIMSLSSSFLSSSPLSPSLLLLLSSSSSPSSSLSLSLSLLSSSLLISSLSFSVLSSAMPLILSQQLGGVKSVH